MDSELWRSHAQRVLQPSTEAVVAVQCGLEWLREGQLALRNALDEALLTAQVRRGSSLRIDRLVLHNLPVAISREPDFRSVTASFDEWQSRLATACSLVPSPTPRIHRLIIRGDQPGAPLPDMVAVLENGQWSLAEQASSALQLIGAAGRTTPLTGYDVDLSGPFSDSDPSVHM